MIRADLSDRDHVIDILVAAFDTNKSVNHVVPRDRDRDRRMRELMAYSFDVCHQWGDVFLSDDRTGCALLLLPQQKRFSVAALARDARLVFRCFGLRRAGKVLRRETAIKKLQPKGPGYYLWFIGVDPAAQHRGAGSALMREIITTSECISRPLYLETSVEQNLMWYRKFGFRVYHELDLGYRLFFMRRD